MIDDSNNEIIEITFDHIKDEFKTIIIQCSNEIDAAGNLKNPEEITLEQENDKFIYRGNKRYIQVGQYTIYEKVTVRDEK